MVPFFIRSFMPVCPGLRDVSQWFEGFHLLGIGDQLALRAPFTSAFRDVALAGFFLALTDGFETLAQPIHDVPGGGRLGIVGATTSRSAIFASIAFCNHVFVPERRQIQRGVERLNERLGELHLRRFDARRDEGELLDRVHRLHLRGVMERVHHESAPLRTRDHGPDFSGAASAAHRR